MKCLLDLDGVLVDFVGGAAKLHGFDPALAVRWDFMADVGLTQNQFWSPLGEDFWANLPWMPDGMRILAIVEKAFGPENVCLLTSPCDTDGCMQGKLRWIRKHLPVYNRRYLMGSAKEFCASRDSLLIDDSDSNTTKFATAGGWGVLVPRPWNVLAGRDPVEWVHTCLMRKGRSNDGCR